MTLFEVCELLNCRVLTGEEWLSREVETACGSDLMSDVLAFVKADVLLLTGLVNIQSVNTADIAEATAVVYVRGKTPDDRTRRLAREKGLPLLSTTLRMYEACGRLYQAGLRDDGEVS